VHRLEPVLACPACGTSLQRLRCLACGRALERRDGWLIVAVSPKDLPITTRSRFEVYGRPLAARVYDLDVLLASRLLYGAAVKRQADFLDEALEETIRTDLPLLDVPGGSGLVLTRALGRRLRRPPLVIADVSEQMLRRTRARIGEDPLYVLADVANLPFAAATFGAAHSGNGFHVFPDTKAAASQIARVTNPEGSVFATTWVLNGRSLPERLMRAFAKRGLCNEPRPRTYFQAAFEQAGLQTTRAEITGSLLLWRGSRARATV
jgi:ubiquinone/menaquinone biosynthesis C-methylase UbiE